jgi:3',5'-cyclic AMP phosphodiesterase CpdA
MLRVIQISDTHLSRQKPHFAGNWPPLAAWIAAERPDLVIHTGDLTVDGADTEDDLSHCAALMRDLGVRFRALPGNHDVGDARHRHQPVDAARLARWQRHFGPDHWVDDAEDWRLIGIDAMLIGSGEPEEVAQLAWLEEMMAAADGRRLAWFLHKPLFLDRPDEGDTGYWSVKPEPRRPLLALLRRHRVALVASGHLHKARDFVDNGTRYLWAPSSAFLCGPSVQAEMPGDKRLGAVSYRFETADFRAEIVDVPGLIEHWIDDLIEEVYPLHLDSRPTKS